MSSGDRGYEPADWLEVRCQLCAGTGRRNGGRCTHCEGRRRVVQIYPRPGIRMVDAACPIDGRPPDPDIAAPRQLDMWEVTP